MKLYRIALFISVLFIGNILCDVKITVSDVAYIKDESTGNSVAAVGMGDEFVLKVVSTSHDRDQPTIKGLENFDVISRSSSHQISFINGKQQSKTEYIYTLRALNEGMFDLISSSGGTIQAIRVQRKAPSQAGTFQGQALCTLSLDKESVVEGEPLILKARFYPSENAVGDFMMDTPALEGFFVKEIQGVKTMREEIEGSFVQVFEKIFMITPLKVGQKIIDPVRVTYKIRVSHQRRERGLFDSPLFSSFFDDHSYQKKIITSNAIAINVDPLPAYPERIDAVGQFSRFTIGIDSDEVSVNEPITLSCEIEGNGNFDQIESPKLVLNDSFKWYESDTAFTQDITNGYAGGKKKFSYVLQAKKPGELKIVPQKFTYFDTALREYKTLYSSPLHLTVAVPDTSQTVVMQTPSSPSHDNQGQQPCAKEVFTQDIQYIEEDGPIFNRPREGMSWYFFIFLLVAPILVFIFGWQFLKKRIGRFGAKTPYKKACLYLKDIESTQESSRIYDVMRTFLMEISALQQHQIGEENVRIFLCEKKWSEETIDGFIDFLNICGSLSFSSSKDYIQTQDLVSEAKKWLDMLQKGDV